MTNYSIRYAVVKVANNAIKSVDKETHLVSH